MSYPFLSDEWIAEARAIRAGHGAQPADGAAIRLNVTITGVPFGEGTVEGYIDTSSGSAELELGQLDEADVSLTTDYATARVLFVDQDQAAAMQALMAGKVIVQGDLMQLMALNATLATDPAAAEIAASIQAITE